MRSRSLRTSTSVHNRSPAIDFLFACPPAQSRWTTRRHVQTCDCLTDLKQLPDEVQVQAGGTVPLKPHRQAGTNPAALPGSERYGIARTNRTCELKEVVVDNDGSAQCAVRHVELMAAASAPALSNFRLLDSIQAEVRPALRSTEANGYRMFTDYATILTVCIPSCGQAARSCPPIRTHRTSGSRSWLILRTTRSGEKYSPITSHSAA